MRTIRLGLACLVATSAWAKPDCKAECAQTIKDCKTQCAKVNKKRGASIVTFCQQKCEEFRKTCEKGCDDKKNH